MSIKYNFDVLAELKQRGITTYTLRTTKGLSEGAIQRIRHGDPISWANIDTLCSLLNCQPGDLLEWVPDLKKDNSITQ